MLANVGHISLEKATMCSKTSYLRLFLKSSDCAYASKLIRASPSMSQSGGPVPVSTEAFALMTSIFFGWEHVFPVKMCAQEARILRSFLFSSDSLRPA